MKFLYRSCQQWASLTLESMTTLFTLAIPLSHADWATLPEIPQLIPPECCGMFWGPMTSPSASIDQSSLKKSIHFQWNAQVSTMEKGQTCQSLSIILSVWEWVLFCLNLGLFSSSLPFKNVLSRPLWLASRTSSCSFDSDQKWELSYQ